MISRTVLPADGGLRENETPYDIIHRFEKIPSKVYASDSEAVMAIADKIVMGKINKYYKENCLVEQQFVIDGDLTVGKYVEKTAKELGADIKIKSFVRYEKGEGIEKREDNFAEEIADIMARSFNILVSI